MKNERTNKIIITLTAISIFIVLFSVGYEFLLPLYLSIKYQVDLRGASSIGIIGGADGPTSIFVSNQQSFFLIGSIFALLSIAGIAYIIINKRKRR